MIEKELEKEILKITNNSKTVEHLFLCCEKDGDKEKLLDFILKNKPNKNELILQASIIGIESGTLEGELEEV